jgi:hypothetical protein
MATLQQGKEIVDEMSLGDLKELAQYIDEKIEEGDDEIRAKHEMDAHDDAIQGLIEEGYYDESQG